MSSLRVYDNFPLTPPNLPGWHLGKLPTPCPTSAASPSLHPGSRALLGPNGSPGPSRHRPPRPWICWCHLESLSQFSYCQSHPSPWYLRSTWLDSLSVTHKLHKGSEDAPRPTCPGPSSEIQTLRRHRTKRAIL